MNKQKRKEMKKEKLWMRFGGYVVADETKMKAIKAGNVFALTKAIEESGIELDGESYIPSEDGDETNFEIVGIHLKSDKDHIAEHEKAVLIASISNGRSIVFTGTIRFHGEDASETQRFCYCRNDEEYFRLSDDKEFDESIFYYYQSFEEISESINGIGDFTLEKITGVEFID